MRVLSLETATQGPFERLTDAKRKRAGLLILFVTLDHDSSPLPHRCLAGEGEVGGGRGRLNMKTQLTHRWAKRAGLLTATGVLALAPLFTAPPSAEAASRYERETRLSQRQVSMTGVVTRDLGGDQFEVRASNGRTYRVRMGRRLDEPRSIDRGDRVHISGRLRDNGVIVAQNVEFLRDTRDNGYRNGNSGYSNRSRTLTGTVVRDLGGDRFELRADNGRTYRVNVGRYDEPRSLDRGDRVRLTGYLQNDNQFNARNIEFLRDTRSTGYRNGSGYGQRTLTGVVTRDLGGDEFEIRATNGRTYRVNVGRYDEPRSLDRGDRVRVTGRLTDNNRMVAQNIEFLRDTRNTRR